MSSMFSQDSDTVYRRCPGWRVLRRGQKQLAIHGASGLWRCLEGRRALVYSLMTKPLTQAQAVLLTRESPQLLAEAFTSLQEDGLLLAAAPSATSGITGSTTRDLSSIGDCSPELGGDSLVKVISVEASGHWQELLEAFGKTLSSEQANKNSISSPALQLHLCGSALWENAGKVHEALRLAKQKHSFALSVSSLGLPDFGANNLALEEFWSFLQLEAAEVVIQYSVASGTYREFCQALATAAVRHLPARRPPTPQEALLSQAEQTVRCCPTGLTVLPSFCAQARGEATAFVEAATQTGFRTMGLRFNWEHFPEAQSQLQVIQELFQLLQRFNDYNKQPYRPITLEPWQQIERLIRERGCRTPELGPPSSLEAGTASQQSACRLCPFRAFCPALKAICTRIDGEAALPVDGQTERNAHKWAGAGPSCETLKVLAEMLLWFSADRL